MLLCRNKHTGGQRKPQGFHWRVRKTKTMPAFTPGVFAVEPTPEVGLLGTKLLSRSTCLLFLYFFAGKVVGSKLLSTSGLNVKLPFKKLQEKIIKYLSYVKSGKMLSSTESLICLTGFGQPNPNTLRILTSY